MAILNSVKGQAQPVLLYRSPQWDPESLLHLGRDGEINCLGQTTIQQRCRRRIGRPKVEKVLATLANLSFLEPATAADMPTLKTALQSLLCSNHKNQTEAVERLCKALRGSQSAVDPVSMYQRPPSATAELQQRVSEMTARCESAEAAARLYEAQCSQLRRENKALVDALAQAEQQLVQAVGAQAQAEQQRAQAADARAQAAQQQAQVVEEQREQIRSLSSERDAARRRIEELEAQLKACRAARATNPRDSAEAPNGSADAGRAEPVDNGAPEVDAKAAEAGGRGRRMHQATRRGSRPDGTAGRSWAANPTPDRDDAVRAYRDTWADIDKSCEKLTCSDIVWPVWSGKFTDVTEHNVREFFQHAAGILPVEQERQRWTPEKMKARVSSTVTRGVAGAIATVHRVLGEFVPQ
ncbi:hypothetical protein NKR23_g8953 [Pleurostoma richardsiae]|uniref:Uncharacterized protein n=1 Tax=Pleurostoma richardsiae TaxID=41990 RepID=A0AA38VNN3_9PEZI|nr:hypothetical protein NKR23_g8953 [Pleurostoma richardsiae]